MKKTLHLISSMVLTGVVSLGTHASSVGPIGGGTINEIRLQDSNGGMDLYAVYDESAGTVAIGTFRKVDGLDSETEVVEVRSRGYFNGKFLTAADLDGDGRDEVILPAYGANQLLTLTVRGTTNLQVAIDVLATGPGPEAAAAAQLNLSSAQELLVASTAAAKVTVRGWDMIKKEEIIGKAEFVEGFAQNGLLGFQTAGASRIAVNPILGLLHQDAGDPGFPVLTLLAASPSPVGYNPMNDFRTFRSRAGHTILLSGHPDGGSNPGWFLGYTPGSATLEFFPSTRSGDSELVALGTPVQSVQFIPEVDDEVLVLSEQGEIDLYDFTPGSGLTFKQTLTPPAGTEFVSATGGNGSVHAVTADASGQLTEFHLFDKNSGGSYEPINQGVWPDTTVDPGKITVTLYTGNPFSTPQPFPFETFLAGDWATMASYSGSGGGQITASVERFGGTSEGLGNRILQALQPSADPGANAQALGNQWEPSSSLFFASPAPIVNGLATVAIKPAAGTYPNTIGVTFTAPPPVTVHYRVNQGPWSSGLGPIWITQDSTVQFYGEHVNGSLSTIQSASYEIDQAFDNDTDGDFVPDAIEALANTNPFDPDSDGDGENDFSELLGEGDPNDPASQSVTKIDSFSIRQLVVTWDDTNTAALPARGEPLFVSDLSNIDQGSATGSRLEPWVWRKNVEDGIISVTKFWLASNYQLETGDLPATAGAAMVALSGFVPSIPIPAIPVLLDDPDPLGTWIETAKNTFTNTEPQLVESTIGPASTMAALVFEYWYGQRLVDLGLIPSILDRPLIAEPPQHARAEGSKGAEVEALQQPLNQNGNLVRHEITHAVQQTARLVVHTPEWTDFRDTAVAVYDQAVQANIAGTPLDPPLVVLRGILDNKSSFPGYALPHDPAALVLLRDPLLAEITPQTVLQLTGVLSFAGNDLTLTSGSGLYQLLDDDGERYRLPGTGLITEGSSASVEALFWTNGPPQPGFTASLRVLSLTIDDVPTSPGIDVDGNRLPDPWEWFFLGGLGSGFWTDGDGDGFVIGEEYAAGTDPRNSLSTPSGEPATPQDLALRVDEDGSPSVQWIGSLTAHYELWMSTNLVDWTPHGAVLEREPDGRHMAPVEFDRRQASFLLLLDIPLRP